MTKTAGLITTRSPDELNELFRTVAAADLPRFGVPEAAVRWLFAERLAARGERGEMGFSGYEGPAHIAKFFGWLRRAELADFFGADVDDLIAASLQTDRTVFSHYGLPFDEALVRKIGRYNAQDYVLQRAYSVPERQQIRVFLDFGAGHGRMANLAFSTPRTGGRLRSYVAVDGIPSTYFTQAAYFAALGLTVWDYFDQVGDTVGAAEIAAAIGSHDIVHLPTWCLPLVPDGAVDMISCVQVLKELPGELVPWLLPHFGRIVQPAGSLYVRDHPQFHNPNHMPIDLLIQAAGFALEFAPMWRDRSEIHGLPRIWRKVDATLFV